MAVIGEGEKLRPQNGPSFRFSMPTLSAEAFQLISIQRNHR